MSNFPAYGRSNLLNAEIKIVFYWIGIQCNKQTHDFVVSNSIRQENYLKQKHRSYGMWGVMLHALHLKSLDISFICNCT